MTDPDKLSCDVPAIAKFRLCIMMFIQYFAFGATMPVMSLYFRDHLNFTGLQIGIVLAMPAIAAFVSPLISACIADRIIRAERLLAFCHFFAAAFMAVLCSRTTFPSVLLLYLAYSLVAIPTIALTTAVTFHHIPKDTRQFGRIRVWGTIGWIAAAWFFSFVWIKGASPEVSSLASKLPMALKLGAAASLAQGFYALTLPDSGAKPAKLETIIPIESLKVITHPHVLLLCVLCFITALVDKFYFLGMGPYLAYQGYSQTAIMPVMSIGQIPEIFTMLILAACLARFGFKNMIVLGIALNLWRFTALAMGSRGVVLYSGICCHGMAYTFVAVSASIFLDTKCGRQSRAGAHQLFALIMSGFAGLLGNLSAGYATDIFTNPQGQINYTAFWTVPASIAAIALIITIAFFPKNQK